MSKPGDATPGPWRNDQKPDPLIICDAEGGSIADCAPAGPWISFKTAKANADLIVEAVNSYPSRAADKARIAALTEALKEALPIVADRSGGGRMLTSQKEASRVFDLIQDTLAVKPKGGVDE